VGGGCLGIWSVDGRGCLDGGGGRGQNRRGRRCEAVGSRCGRHRWLGGYSTAEGGSAVLLAFARIWTMALLTQRKFLGYTSRRKALS